MPIKPREPDIKRRIPTEDEYQPCPENRYQPNNDHQQDKIIQQ